MIDVWLRADGQRLSLEDPSQRPVRGTRGLLRLRFELSPEWDGMSAAAAFRGGPAVLVERGRCMVPDACCDMPSFDVRLVGRSHGAVYTTSWARVRQEE